MTLVRRRGSGLARRAAARFRRSLPRPREGRLLDDRQNARGKTIASVYSVRPKLGAPVSTPLRWDELTEDVTASPFGMREALERVEQHGDLFEPVLAGGQGLGRALKKLR